MNFGLLSGNAFCKNNKVFATNCSLIKKINHYNLESAVSGANRLNSGSGRFSKGFLGGSVVEEFDCQWRRCGFDP